MSKRCAKCEKPVYPIEELKCLDKIWHKSCFKCENCGMTLNMKNYKGYEKKPYCVAHYPTTKFTAVADTPENRRIATNTKLQSSIDYHSDFEKNKSKYTAIADNPDLLRCKMATMNASLINYHSEFEKTKDKYTVVADNPEVQRCIAASKNVSLIQYHSDFEKSKDKYTSLAVNPEIQRCMEATKNLSGVQYHHDFEKMKGNYTAVADNPEIMRHMENSKNISLVQYHSDFEKNKGTYTPVADTLEMKRHLENAKNISAIKYHEDFEKQKGKRITVADDPELQRIKQNTQIQSEISYKGIKQTRDIMEQRRPEQAQDGQILPPPPMSTAAVGGYPTSGYIPPGKISDYDPYQENQTFNSPYSAKSQATTIYDSRIGQAPAAANPHAGKGMVSKAIYDYTAADTDEVSFVEGDIIIHCQPIDQGWMEGTVERTSQRGMLPSNYVQPV